MIGDVDVPSYGSRGLLEEINCVEKESGLNSIKTVSG